MFCIVIFGIGGRTEEKLWVPRREDEALSWASSSSDGSCDWPIEGLFHIFVLLQSRGVRDKELLSFVSV